MGRFDRARETAERLAEGAKQKGRELALQRKLDGLAKDLGELVFRQKEGESGLDAEIERLISEMRGARSELDALGKD
jgi:hypothetical protein